MYPGCGSGRGAWHGWESELVVVSGVREFIGRLCMYGCAVRFMLDDVVSGVVTEVLSEQNDCCRQLLWSDAKAQDESYVSDGRRGNTTWPKALPVKRIKDGPLSTVAVAWLDSQGGVFRLLLNVILCSVWQVHFSPRVLSGYSIAALTLGNFKVSPNLWFYNIWSSFSCSSLVIPRLYLAVTS